MNNENSGLNTILIIIVALVVIGGAYYWYQGGAMPWGSEPTEYGTDSESATAPSDTLPTGSDASDNALDQDAAAISAQLDAFSSDNASVDAGLNDEQIEQAELQ